MFVDDNSPDGTADKIRTLMKKYNIFLINRNGKLGLSSAYIEGFKWALNNSYDTIIQMDADLSHNPNSIPSLLDEINSNSFCDFFISVCISFFICEIFLFVNLDVK